MKGKKKNPWHNFSVSISQTRFRKTGKNYHRKKLKVEVGTCSLIGGQQGHFSCSASLRKLVVDTKEKKKYQNVISGLTHSHSLTVLRRNK